MKTKCLSSLNLSRGEVSFMPPRSAKFQFAFDRILVPEKTLHQNDWLGPLSSRFVQRKQRARLALKKGCWLRGFSMHSKTSLVRDLILTSQNRLEEVTELLKHAI